MNSGSLKISVSSRMYNLSIYFDCILVLTVVFYLILVVVLGISYMLVRLEVLVVELVLVVQISEG